MAHMQRARIAQLRAVVESESVSYDEVAEIQEAFAEIDPSALPEPAENAGLSDMLDELDSGHVDATCYTCGRSWCDKCHPTPAGRCLFEYEHNEDEEPAYFGEELHDDTDDLDEIVDNVREHRGDYIADVEALVEEVRTLRKRLGR